MLRFLRRSGASVNRPSLTLAIGNSHVLAALRGLHTEVPSLFQEGSDGGDGGDGGGELRENLRRLGGKRKWSEVNRLLAPVSLESIMEDCFEDARKVESHSNSKSRARAKAAAMRRGVDSLPSMLTDVIDAYLFKPSNANVRNLWSILEETRTDPTLAENIGVRRLLRIYKVCGINSIRGGKKNLRTKHVEGMGEKKEYLSEGQVDAMLMHLVEWLMVASRDSRNNYISILLRSGPATLNVSAIDLGRGVIASLIASLQMADASGEEERAAALANVALTTFHVLRRSGQGTEAEALIKETLEGFSPYPARILPEDAYSLAVSGCFRAARTGGGEEEETRGVDKRRHWLKWDVDHDSLSFLVSLILHDNHPRVIRLRQRVLQVLLSYGQYSLVKSTFETMLSSEAPIDDKEGAKGGSLPLIMGTRAHMSLITAHAALASANGVRTALELVTDEKRCLRRLPKELRDSLAVYAPSTTEEESLAADGLPVTKQENGIEVGPDKHVYIAALSTARQDPSTSRRDRRGYQTEVAEALLGRVEDDGVRVDTRFLLQVAELGCDNKDFEMCTRAVEVATTLCRVPVSRPAVTGGSTSSKRSEGLLGATHNTSSTSTSRGQITLTTLLEDVEDSPADAAHRAVSGEIPSNHDLAKIYGYAVLCARKSDRPEDCVLLLYYMLQMGLTPSAASVTHVLKALFHADQHDEVIRIFKLMPKWGVQRESVHAATLVDSLCRLGRLKDAYTGLSYMGPLDPAVRDESRKHLLKQLCFALSTGGRNDQGAGSSRFEYEELLDAIAETCADQLQSPLCTTPTKKMRFARNLVYFMQGAPDDVLEAVLKRVLLIIPPQQGQEQEQEQEADRDFDVSVWIGKVQSLRGYRKQKGPVSGSPTLKASVGGVLEFGASKGFGRPEGSGNN